MTREEFASLDIIEGVTVMYKNIEYEVVGVNFEEELLAVEERCSDDKNDPDYEEYITTWKRIENLTVISINSYNFPKNTD